MTIDRSIVRRERFAVSLVKTAILAAALVVGVSTEALAAGSISGTVTSSTTSLGLAGTVVQFYDLNASGNLPAASATTDASGNYTANLPVGSYAVLTQDIHGYINEIYNNVPCSATCDTNALTPIVVTNSAITGINFVLTPGGRISGTVTSSATGLPIAGVSVNFADSLGQVAFTSGLTDASGNYITNGGTATGNVFAFTTNTQAYQDELYTSFPCENCDVTTGTAIAVTQAGGATGIDFALAPGGGISGTVKDANGAPLANVEVDIEDSTGNILENAVTDGSGNYSTDGFPAGDYYAFTRNNLGLVDQLYNNVTCVKGNCSPTMGTAIPVTVGATASGKNFVLSPGGTVTGTVTAAAGGAPISDVFVGFFTIGTSGPNLGLAIFEGGSSTDSSGQYHNVVLPPGTHFAEIFDFPGFANQLYDGLPCAGTNSNANLACNVGGGTPIAVTAGATIGNVNFALLAGAGSISGTVTNAAGGAPLNGVLVQVFSSTGTTAGSVNSNSSGIYTFNGLPVGSYYVRTSTGGAFINQLYNGVVCVGCVVTTSGGTLVQVTSGATTGNINFALATGGHISGTVTNAATSAPIQGVTVQIFSSTGVPTGTAATNASGVYTSPGLPAGTYYVRTAVTPTQNFIDGLWNSLPCVPCNVTTGSPVMVTGTATTAGVNFALSPGGSISGTATDAGAGGAPVADIPVSVFDSSTLVVLKNTTTDLFGNYTVAGLPGGDYFVRTNPTSPLQNYVAQVYNGVPYTGFLATGTPVAVTVGATHTGVNFSMSSGGSLSGAVTDAGTSAPLAGVGIGVYSPTGRVVKAANTDGAGNFTVTGLQAGTYYVATLAPVLPAPLYVDELYNNLPCLGCVSAAVPIVTLPCTPSCVPTVTTGTPVVITNGTTSTGVNFALASGGGVITGGVTDAVTGIGLLNVQVLVYNTSGVLVKSATSAANTGAYTVRGLAPGTYFARTIVSPATPYYTDVAYGNVACAPCDVTTTTSIGVTANATVTANFALSPGGSITGAVTDATTTNPLPLVNVQLFNATGNLVETTFSGSTGGFTFDGLPAGAYYARTAVPAGSDYVDELYNNILCASCVVTTGAAIVVTDGTTSGGVTFALLPRVAPIQNVITRTNTPIVVPITVESGAGLAGLILAASSSNPALVPNANMVFSGSGTSRTLAITPAANRRGLTTITVSVTDSTGTVSTSFVLQVGIPPFGDFDGDGKADISVFRPSNGAWYIRGATVATTFGADGDIPVARDYDGDGITDIAVFRPSTGVWYIWLSSTQSGISYTFGNGDDIPVPADYDGDGKADIAVFRPSTGVWYIWLSGTQTGITYTWGGGADIPVPADYDGSGLADIAVFRPLTGVWYIWLTATQTSITYTWGGGGDIPVPADYDGDGRTDIAVFRPLTGAWYIWQSSTQTSLSYTWGGGADIPVPSDYDGDGKTDIAVFRPLTGAWYIWQSATQTGFSTTWGGGGDIPILKRP